MAGPPIHAQHQLQPGARRPQAALQPHRTGAAASPPHKARAERPLLGPLDLPIPPPGEGVLGVISGHIPSVPKLTGIAVALPGQGGRQLGHSVGIPELLHPLGAELKRHQTIAQAPAIHQAIRPSRAIRPRPITPSQALEPHRVLDRRWLISHGLLPL